MTVGSLPDWGIVSITQITSSKKGKRQRIGLLPISRSAWYRLVSLGHIPQGRQVGGRAMCWTIRQVREIAEKIANGALSELKIWEKARS